MVLESVRKPDIPRHIAIIMDGNGRWAQARGLPRTVGHKQGAEAARRVTKAAAELGVEYLTLFGFSSENWARPAEEIKELMRLLRMYLRSETAELHRSNICLKVIGDRQPLDLEIIGLIDNAEALTRDNDAMTVVIALNYGGRNDIMQATVKWAQLCAEKGMAPDIAAAEEYFSSCLMTGDMPDPDILIRTSGEQRVSNFLLWQCAYSEMVFSPVLWPDFGRVELEDAIAEYQGRDRRYGAIRAARGE